MKTRIRKTTKAAMKTAQKTAEKAAFEHRWSAIERGFVEIQKAHEKTEKTLNALGLSHRETEKTLNALGLSHRETEKTLNKAIDDLRMSNRETEKTLRESIASTEKTLNKAIGGLSNTIGSLVEHFMTAGLPQKFKQFGFTFDRVTTVKWADGENNMYAEIDGLLENGGQAMVVEVKTTLRNEDVDGHIVRMGKVRKYADLRGDKREFLGAIAATIVDKSSREYALKKGFFVIEPSGEDVKITRPDAEKVW
jgi:ribosomal protein L30/L7E